MTRGLNPQQPVLACFTVWPGGRHTLMHTVQCSESEGEGDPDGIGELRENFLKEVALS